MVVGFLVGYSLDFPGKVAEPVALEQPEEAVVENKASLMLDFGEEAKVFSDLAFAEGETLFDLTKKVAEENNINFVFDPPGEWGVFIKQIGEQVNGAGDRYWQYWVNNEQVQVAADRYQLKAGDVLEWQFVKSSF